MVLFGVTLALDTNMSTGALLTKDMTNVALARALGRTRVFFGLGVETICLEEQWPLKMYVHQAQNTLTNH